MNVGRSLADHDRVAGHAMALVLMAVLMAVTAARKWALVYWSQGRAL